MTHTEVSFATHPELLRALTETPPWPMVPLLQSLFTLKLRSRLSPEPAQNKVEKHVSFFNLEKRPSRPPRLPHIPPQQHHILTLKSLKNPCKNPTSPRLVSPPKNPGESVNKMALNNLAPCLQDSRFYCGDASMW
jgi:hypothetical protein